MSDSAAAGDAVREEIGQLTTERFGQHTTDLDELDERALFRLINEGDQQIPAAVAAAEPAILDAVEAIVRSIRHGGRLFYIGAGTSGRLGILDASECPPTFGVASDLVTGIIAGGDAAIRHAQEGVEDDAVAGASDIIGAGASAGDVVVGIASSGRTPYVLGAVAKARDLGCVTVGLSSNPDAPLSAATDIGIEVVVGPELVVGSTRMRSGTAQKLVLNMLTTISMVRLGRTYGGFPVSLSVTNDKLRARAERFLSVVAGVSPVEAAAALRGAHDDLAVATVHALGGVTVTQAQTLLAASGGAVKTALGRLAASDDSAGRP